VLRLITVLQLAYGPRLGGVVEIVESLLQPTLEPRKRSLRRGGGGLASSAAAALQLTVVTCDELLEVASPIGVLQGSPHGGIIYIYIYVLQLCACIMEYYGPNPTGQQMVVFWKCSDCKAYLFEWGQTSRRPLIILMIR
jgi:hypothetical protein